MTSISLRLSVFRGVSFLVLTSLTGCAGALPPLKRPPPLAERSLLSPGKRIGIEARGVRDLIVGDVVHVSHDTIRFIDQHSQTDTVKLARSAVVALFERSKPRRRIGMGALIGTIAGLPIGWTVGTEYCDRRYECWSRSDYDKARGIGMSAGAILIAVIAHEMLDPTVHEGPGTWVPITWPVTHRW